MLEHQLEQKLKNYLDNNHRTYYPDSINYVSLRNVKQIDDSFKKMHIVSFMVSISDLTYEGDAFYSAAFDEKTLKMEFIVGPQSFEKIEE
jgi:hypothetical protein